jgi:glycine C-acetyltransferase
MASCKSMMVRIRADCASAVRRRLSRTRFRRLRPPVLKAFEIVESAEGHLAGPKSALKRTGCQVVGDPSAIVCVKVGTERVARLVSRQLPDLGLLAKLVEYPAVSKGAARFRMQVMAKHSPQHIADAVARLHRAFDEASREQAAGEPVRLAAVA